MRSSGRQKVIFLAAAALAALFFLYAYGGLHSKQRERQCTLADGEALLGSSARGRPPFFGVWCDQLCFRRRAAVSDEYPQMFHALQTTFGWIDVTPNAERPFKVHGQSLATQGIAPHHELTAYYVHHWQRVPDLVLFVESYDALLQHRVETDNSTQTAAAVAATATANDGGSSSSSSSSHDADLPPFHPQRWLFLETPDTSAQQEYESGIANRRQQAQTQHGAAHGLAAAATAGDETSLTLAALKRSAIESAYNVISPYVYRLDLVYCNLTTYTRTFLPHAASPTYLLPRNDDARTHKVLVLMDSSDTASELRRRAMELFAKGSPHIVQLRDDLESAPEQREQQQQQQQQESLPHENRRRELARRFNEYFAVLSDVTERSLIAGDLFEIPAAGALLVLDCSGGSIMRQLGMLPDMHYVEYMPSALEATVEAVLDPGNRARYDAIRRRGYELVHARHTTAHRAKQLHDLALTLVP